MDRSEFEIIQELMEELQSKMEPSEEDLGSRLGREKPTVEVMSLETDADPLAMEDEMIDGMGDEMDSPDEKLKKRLMKLRG